MLLTTMQFVRNKVRRFGTFKYFTQDVRDVEKLKSFNSIPGPKSYPIIGTLHKYLPVIGDYKAEFLHKNAWLNWTKYGPLVRESLMPGVALLHVYDPDDVEAVFRQDDRHPCRRSHVAMLQYRLSKPDVYNTGGLLSTNGTEWYRLRSAFQKNFTSPQSVKSYTKKTDQIVQRFVEWIKQNPNEVFLDFLPLLDRLYLEIIGEVGFNEKFDSFSSAEQDYNSRSSRTITAAFYSNSGIMKLDKGFMWRFIKTPLYRKMAKSQEYLEGVAKDILYRKLPYFESNKHSPKTSLLDSFLEQPNIDMKDILGMMVDVLMAAIDTTSYSTSFLLYHVANNLECQEKLYEETIKLLPHHDTDITPEILSKAVYARSCIKESLRLNPVSIGVGRLLQKDISLRGYHIPKGTVIVTQNMTSSRLRQFVKNPLQYKPERWMKESEHYEKIHPFCSLPFGFGPRSCIARRLAEQNMQIVLLRMIREVRLEWSGSELGVKTFLINKPDLPVSFILHERTK